MNQQTIREKSFYYQCLNELFLKQKDGENVCNEMGIVKSKLLEIEQRKMIFYRYTFKTSNLIENEKLSTYQITSRIKNSTPSKLLSLRSNERITSNTSELKSIIYNHFKNIFNKKPNSDTNDNFILRHIKTKLNDEDCASLSKPIELNELKNAIFDASNKSSPGPDGLNYDFYKTFFEILKTDMLNVFNSYLILNEYPPGTFSAGIISLIPKKGDIHDLNNRRPISMLNTDYKILTKIFWNRLQPLMNKLIGPGQSACVSESSCINNLRTLRNVLIKSKLTKHFKSLLLSIDLEKAFDGVDHEFLWKVLEQFGFPRIFIECLKRLYKNATSTVLFNGFFTYPIKIESSVRQGCPLSMALFCLYIEPLIRMLYESIKGCLIGDCFVKVIAYADDVSLLIRNDHEFDKALELINYFSIYAKIKINTVKSQFMRLNNCSSGPHQIKEVDNLKILGVTFHYNFDSTVTGNYNNLITNLKHAISLHHRRILNIYQKAFILNTYVLSKLWYIAQIFPPNNKHIAEIRKICFKFLWQGYFYSVAKIELYLPIYKGGLGLEDVESKTKSLFIKNLLFAKNASPSVDEYMIAQNHNRHLTRNAREWICLSIELKPRKVLNTSKLFYNYFIDQLNIKPRMQTELPNLDWETIFENLDKKFISSNAKTYLFSVLNELIPTRSKMYRHKIAGIDSPICLLCGNLDSITHRIKSCGSSAVIWNWISNIILIRFRIDISDPEELIALKWNPKNWHRNAGLWLVLEALRFNVNNYGLNGMGCLDKFKKEIRDARWNNRIVFLKYFKHVLDIC